MKNTEIGNKTANINIKKQQFVTASHWHLGEVMEGNITFFIIFGLVA